MSETHEDFVSFEKALRDLQMRSEELKKLVSEGEIRAFRDGQSMKFRKEDVDALASHQAGEDELVLADALEDDTGMVTEELSEEDTLLVEDDLDEIDEEAAPARVPQARTRREQRSRVSASCMDRRNLFSPDRSHRTPRSESGELCDPVQER